MNTVRKTITAAAVAGGVAVGGLAGAVLGVPVVAGAQEDAPTEEAASWVQEALGGLVDDGTLTQAQADAVEDALRETRPDRPFGFGGPRVRHVHHLDVVAEALGMTTDELRESLADGDTIAEVAAAEGVDVQAVVDAIVGDIGERIEEKVAEGDLTQEEADEILADAEERATALVNGERPDRLHGPGRRGPFGRP